MSYEEFSICVAMVATGAIEDMAKTSEKPIAQIRKEVLESKAFEGLLDEETHLWAEGPDYFRWFLRQVEEHNS